MISVIGSVPGLTPARAVTDLGGGPDNGVP